MTKQNLELKELRQWLRSPTSQAVKSRFEELVGEYNEAAYTGAYLDLPATELVKVYSKNIGYVMALEKFINIWENPDGFLLEVNVDRVDDPEGQIEHEA